jgi:pSer/pThr/pTyr-binding forkhead associated (FHA) protein
VRLVVVEGKAKGKQVRLEERPSFVVGSSAEADVRLEDPGVADVHLKVYPEGDGYLAFDISSQGFVCNGSRTQRALIGVGDTLELGSHVLRVLSDAVEVPKNAPKAAPAAPSPAALAKALVAAGPSLVAHEGNDAGKTFALSGKQTFIIGRGVATDITLWDIRASRAHARVDRQPDGSWRVTDLNSSNGTHLNDARLEGGKPLGPGDRIRIGSTVLEFAPGPSSAPAGSW